MKVLFSNNVFYLLLEEQPYGRHKSERLILRVRAPVATLTPQPTQLLSGNGYLRKPRGGGGSWCWFIATSLVFALQHQSRQWDCLSHYGVGTDVTSLEAAKSCDIWGMFSPKKKLFGKQVICSLILHVNVTVRWHRKTSKSFEYPPLFEHLLPSHDFL